MAVARSIDTDRRDNKNLTESMSYMRKNETMCDFTFLVGSDKKPIGAHKYMLASRSSFFRDIFNNLKDTNNISIPDVSVSTIDASLRYIYTDEVPTISNDNVSEMLSLSDRFRISRIKKECKKFLRMIALTTDAAKALQTAYNYGFDNILDQSLSYIENNTGECLSSKHTVNLSKECLQLILKSEYLSCLENELFSFFLKWIENQCDIANIKANGENMRNLAGDLLFSLKLQFVDIENFTKDKTKGLLTSNEELSIRQFQSRVQEDTFPFSNQKRISVAGRPILHAIRFQGQPQMVCRSNYKEAVQFETSKDIRLKGVIIGSPLHPDQQFLPFSCGIRIQVLSCYYKEICSCDNIILSSQSNTTSVTFLEPVRITRSSKYTITIEVMQDLSYYTTNCLKLLAVGDVTISFEKSPLCNSGTDVNMGQIFAGLMFII